MKKIFVMAIATAIALSGCEAWQQAVAQTQAENRQREANTIHVVYDNSPAAVVGQPAYDPTGDILRTQQQLLLQSSQSLSRDTQAAINGTARIFGQ